MNELGIRNELRRQQEYVNEAKRMADNGYTERSVISLTQARRCQDKISSMLLEIENEGPLVAMTPEIAQRGIKVSDHPYAQETRKIFWEGLNYCSRKLGEAELRRMMN